MNNQNNFSENGNVSTLLIATEKNGKTTNVRIPLTVVRFGLDLGSALGGLKSDHVTIIDNAIKSGLAGEILSVDGENGEKVTISLV